MAFNVKAAIDAAKNKGPDMTKAQGGGGYELPAEGFVRLRLVGYIETGKKESEWKGVKKVNDYADLVFELSGPKHEPREGEGGVKYPQRVTQQVKLSFNEKSTFFKLFSTMNWEGKATHIAQLLGDAFVGKVVHTVKKYPEGDRTFVNLVDIRKPFATNPETGDEYKLEVAPQLTELKLFLWDFASPEMWDALFIEGEYEAKTNDKGEETHPARSKNVIQNKIRKALNWKGNAVYDYAEKRVTQQDSDDLDALTAVEEVSSPAQGGADPLEGVA